MSETAKMRKLLTKRGTLEILIPLCCSTRKRKSEVHAAAGEQRSL
jgi:hypothetical protein